MLRFAANLGPLWNQRGRAFCEVGYLFGVGLESDSRNVVTDDLDGDGRMDLVLTSMEIWPAERQTAQVFRNVLATQATGLASVSGKKATAAHLSARA